MSLKGYQRQVPTILKYPKVVSLRLPVCARTTSDKDGGAFRQYRAVIVFSPLRIFSSFGGVNIMIRIVVKGTVARPRSSYCLDFRNCSSPYQYSEPSTRYTLGFRPGSDSSVSICVISPRNSHIPALGHWKSTLSPILSILSHLVVNRFCQTAVNRNAHQS